MILYHYTRNHNLKSIFEEGLKPNGIGIVYLCPAYEIASQVVASSEYENILEVDTGDCKLTSFEDCSEWEVLCWTGAPLPPESLRLVRPILKEG